jgi:hypothetical protein
MFAVAVGGLWRRCNRQVGLGRDGADYSARYPELAVLGRLPAGTVLNGELVRWGPEGLSNLGAILPRHHLTHPARIAEARHSPTGLLCRL